METFRAFSALHGAALSLIVAIVAAAMALAQLPWTIARRLRRPRL